jgi:superkiller protein 3
VRHKLNHLAKLPGLYENILNHPNTSDQLRRDTESKLLRHRQRYLYALPTSSEYASEKNAAYKVVEDMASGAVLLGIRDELAWSCYMENLDVYDIGMTSHLFIFSPYLTS